MFTNQMRSAMLWSNLYLAGPMNKLVDDFWWNHVFKASVKIYCPKKNVYPDDYHGFFSWLEKNIGRQGKDWNWRWESIETKQNVNVGMIIKTRKKYRERLAEFALLFG